MMDDEEENQPLIVEETKALRRSYARGHIQHLAKNSLIGYLKGRVCQGFKPIPRYSEDGNYIEWFWSDKGTAYSESIQHDGVWIGSVHRDMETKEVVGVTIHLEAVK